MLTRHRSLLRTCAAAVWLVSLGSISGAVSARHGKLERVVEDTRSLDSILPVGRHQKRSVRDAGNDAWRADWDNYEIQTSDELRRHEPAAAAATTTPLQRFNNNNNTVEEQRHFDRFFTIRAHNKLRQKVQPAATNMLFLTWSRELEKKARQWTSRCVWSRGLPPTVDDNSRQTTAAQQHSRQLGATVGGLGQNLWAAPVTSSPRPVRVALSTWMSEHTVYYYNEDEHCTQEDCGNYAQTVWAKSEFIGCASQYCPTLKGYPTVDGTSTPLYFVVCYYSPGGDINTSKPYDIGRSCSQCPSTHNQCIDKLCAPHPQCSHVTDCPKPKPPHCLCQSLYYDLNEEELLRLRVWQSTAPRHMARLHLTIIGYVITSLTILMLTL